MLAQTKFSIPYIDLSNLPASPEALAVLPQEVAEKFKVFPISVDSAGKQLVLAMADPMDLSAIEFIEQKTALRVKPQAAEASKIIEFIAGRYSTSLAREVTEALKEVSPEGENLKMFETNKMGIIREEKIAEIVSHILNPRKNRPECATELREFCRKNLPRLKIYTRHSSPG